MALQVAAAAMAFNLVCTGTLTTTAPNAPAPSPYRIEYRVDLKAGLWCQDDCSTRREIFEVTQNEITLDWERDYRARMVSAIVMDRNTGTHLATISDQTSDGSGRIRRWGGKCARAAFTGFPAETRKF